MPKRIRDYGLTLALLGLFVFSLAGQFFFGFSAYNEELKEKGLAPLAGRWEYATSGHFVSSVGENWESEFLQMGFFVLLTVFLMQKGAADSKPERELGLRSSSEDEHYRSGKIRWHPIAWRIYENSLTIALFVLFVLSFLMHAKGSLDMMNADRLPKGEPALDWLQLFGESEFWFESFQNWQSEFFSIAVLGILSIFLRQRGSSQSKPLNAPTWSTGGE